MLSLNDRSRTLGRQPDKLLRGLEDLSLAFTAAPISFLIISPLGEGAESIMEDEICPIRPDR